jgi:hypothetical protein
VRFFDALELAEREREVRPELEREEINGKRASLRLAAREALEELARERLEKREREPTKRERAGSFAGRLHSSSSSAS